MYPELSQVCELAPSGASLTAKVDIGQNANRLQRLSNESVLELKQQRDDGRRKIAEFCDKYLEPHSSGTTIIIFLSTKMRAKSLCREWHTTTWGFLYWAM